MIRPLLTLVLLGGCTPESPKDTAPVDSGAGAGDTAGGDTGDSGADTSDTSVDSADTGDTGDTGGDTADTDDAVCTTTPSVMLYTPSTGLWTDFTASIPTALPAVSFGLNEPGGEVRFCGGTWYTYMHAETDVTISGAYGAIVNAGGYSTGLEIQMDGIEVTIRDLTLTGGVANKPVDAGGVGGGGILCERLGATLRLDGVTITGNTSATYGGGMYIDGCSVSMNNVAITNNTASAGAGAFLIGIGAPTVVDITGSTIGSNAASLGGGGIYAMTGGADATVNLVDTFVSANTSVRGGGGIAIADGAIAGATTSVTCTATGAGAGGFEGNAAGDATLPGGGIYLISWYGSPAEFTSAGCDFGTSGTADDNTPADVFVYGKSSYAYGDGASFSCDGAGCN